MSLVISSELLNFKTKVEPNLASMNDSNTLLAEKVKQIIDVNASTKSEIKSYYFSENKDVILENFDKINQYYNKISTVLENDLASVLSDSAVLLENIKKIEELKIEIDNAQNILNNIGGERSYSRNSDGEVTNKQEVDAYNRERRAKINSANEIINQKKPEFIRLHDEALALYNSLKSKGSSSLNDESFETVDSSNLEYLLKDSSFEKYSFTASNGVSIDYYLYVPGYGEGVDNLPVHLYLHGSGERGSRVLKQSLPKLLSEGKTPSGIVICPQSVSGNWNDDNLDDALIELTDSVVKYYSADSSRVSLSGHSSGAIGGYKIVKENPNYFSAFVPISGHARLVGNDYEAISDLPIWAFHGASDNSVKYSLTEKVYNSLKQQGYDNMTIEKMNGGHGIQNAVFTEEYEYSDGVTYDPLEWAFSQKRSE